MKTIALTTAAAVLLTLSASAAMAAGNGKGNNGNGKGNGGNTKPVVTPPVTTPPVTTPVITVPAAATCAASNISVSGARCIGFASGNLNGNNPSIGDINQLLGGWGVHLNSAVASSAMLSGLSGGTTINFTQQLYGDTIVGIHYGNVVDASGNKANNVTAFYRFDAGQGAGIDSFTTTFDSLSNATLYSTGKAPVLTVPEPSTYAMMFAGLGLMGLVARRRKQQ
nr:PEP-CTERM sorting domain-containing protein [uncultured Duganella sp.]